MSLNYCYHLQISARYEPSVPATCCLRGGSGWSQDNKELPGRNAGRKLFQDLGTEKKQVWRLSSFGRGTVPEEVAGTALVTMSKHTVNAWTRPSGAPLVPDAFGQYQSQALSCCSKRESQSWMLAFTVLRGLYCNSELDHRSAWKCVCTLRSVCCPLHVNIMAWHCEHNNCDTFPLLQVWYFPGYLWPICAVVQF